MRAKWKRRCIILSPLVKLEGVVDKDCLVGVWDSSGIYTVVKSRALKVYHTCEASA